MRALPFQEIGLNEPWCASPFPHRCVPRKSEGCEGRRKLLFPGNFRRPLRLWNLLWSVAQFCCAVYRWKIISRLLDRKLQRQYATWQSLGNGQGNLCHGFHVGCIDMGLRTLCSHRWSSNVCMAGVSTHFENTSCSNDHRWLFIWLITRVCIMTISAASRSKSFMLHTQTIWNFANILDRLDIGFFVFHWPWRMWTQVYMSKSLKAWNFGYVY